MPHRRLLLPFFFVLWTAQALAAGDANVSEEARRHVIRGRTALEMAKSPEDYRQAIAEFQQAAKLAPDWADVHYNLGAVEARAGDYQAAITSYRRYLELAPDAGDARKVRDEIIRLEYMLERKARTTTLAGEWVDNPMPGLPALGPPYYVFGFEGNTLVVHAALPEPKGVAVVYDMLGGAVSQDFFAKGNMVERFELQVDGDTLRGVYVRPEFVEEHSGCTIPEARSSAEGRVVSDAGRVELRYTRPKYLARFTSVLFFDQCSSVVPAGSEEIKLSLVRRQKR